MTDGDADGVNTCAHELVDITLIEPRIPNEHYELGDIPVNIYQ